MCVCVCVCVCVISLLLLLAFGSLSFSLSLWTCRCKEGVAGASCDVCEDGWFNLTSTGCEECGCHSTGSTNNTCDDYGHCACQVRTSTVSLKKIKW